MEIRLKLNEMFAIGRVLEKQPILGYRAALTKLFHKMLDVEEFSKIIEIYEEIKINEANVMKEFESQRVELSEKIQKNGSKEVPPELQKQLAELNNQITERLKSLNGELLNQVNKMLEDETIQYDFEFDGLLQKSISNIVESEKTAQELGIEEGVVKFLIDVYLKFEQK